MNNGNQISVSMLVGATLWGVAAALLVAGWIVMWAGSHEWAVMLAFTSVFAMAAAMVVTIRSYICRTCVLVRTLHGIEEPEPAWPQAVR